jgi:hypothetical protein
MTSNNLVARPAQGRDLKELADKIKTAHAAVLAVAKSGALKAMEAGELLKQAKDAVPHGECAVWLRRCNISDRTARLYMQVADHRADFENGNALPFVSLRQAAKAIGKRKSKEEPPAITPPRSIEVKEVTPAEAIEAARLIGLAWSGLSVQTRASVVSALFDGIGIARFAAACSSDQRAAFIAQSGARVPAVITNGHAALPADGSIPEFLHRTAQ